MWGLGTPDETLASAISGFLSLFTHLPVYQLAEFPCGLTGEQPAPAPVYRRGAEAPGARDGSALRAEHALVRPAAQGGAGPADDAVTAAAAVAALPAESVPADRARGLDSGYEHNTSGQAARRT